MKNAMSRHQRRRDWRKLVTRGFTLVEMLVVITIILLVSAVTLPVIIPALSNRQVGESARILQAAISGARDAAIRANAPRGIRLLPDTSPGFNNPPQFDGNGNLVQPGVLTYSRMIPIEPGPEYSQGHAQIVDDLTRLSNSNMYTYYYAPYSNPSSYFNFPSGYNPEPPNYDLTTAPAYNPPYYSVKGKVLRLEEQAYHQVAGVWVPNNPTSWWWNIRVGDKLRLDGTGQYYTVVGPVTIHPTTANGGLNPELFVNDGPPADVRSTSKLQYNYGGTGLVGIEFLYLVNGQDDDLDGYVDDGWDGIDNNLLNGADDIKTDAASGLASNAYNYGEWESEAWLGSFASYNLHQASSISTLPPPSPFVPVDSNLRGKVINYTITRRPVPSPSAREIALPGATVIDATTWNSTAERSRLPIDPVARTVDIMVNQSGEVVSTYPYSTPASFPITGAFYHFWIADRSDVVDPLTNLTFPSLPMVEGSPHYSGTVFLKKDRALLTLFTKSGLLVTNSIESFDAQDSELPYRGAQLGTTEVK